MNKSKIKIYAILILVFSTGLFLAYGAGTFNPNKWTVKSIAENIKYEMRTEWKSLGLKEPSIEYNNCLLYTSPSPRDVHLSRMPSSA